MNGRFGDMRHFMWTVGGVVGATMGIAVILDPAVEVAYAIPLSAMALLALGVYALSRVDNHGRGRTLTSGLQRGAARLFVGPIKPCGCWQEADAESVDRELYVRRNGGGGGKVCFEARQRVLLRCHECGRHYHEDRSAKLKRVGDVDALANIGDTDTHFSSSLDRSVEVWPEDEPPARELFTAPVEDREVKA